METNWGPLGYVTYKRTYSRPIDGADRLEEWNETIDRCLEALVELGIDLNNQDLDLLHEYLLTLKCSLSGRSLWQLGTSSLYKIGGDSLQSCWHVDVDSLESFIFAFDQLMLGGGVGFNILPEFVYELPRVQAPHVQHIEGFDVDFIVPDNREGWCALLEQVLLSYFISGKDFTYSTSAIRQKGAPIKGFGGVASGPSALLRGIDNICKILDRRRGKKIRPIDALDIMNIIGSIVVAGNVRRSAQIALGDPGDPFYMSAKNWETGTVPNWRAMSNNSIIANSYDNLGSSFWDTYDGSGEPYGIINLENFRKYGRLIDLKPDPRITGTNPCVEIGLESNESCNLAEIFLPRLEDIDEFKTATRLMYYVTKTISGMNFRYNKTNEVVKRNRRLGISVTGYYQSQWVNDALTFDEVYRYLEDIDRDYSRKHNCPQSIKMTTVKPSGTLSLLPGVTPGAHPAFSSYYIRRVRMSANHDLVETCRTHGYPIEHQVNFDGTVDPDTVIVSFPVDHSDAVTADDVDVIDMLETQKFLQSYWSDNSVSITCYYEEGDIERIKNWLQKNFGSIKCVSFLLKQDHGFKQAPYEAISRGEYLDLVENVTPITEATISTLESENQLNVDCDGGGCGIR